MRVLVKDDVLEENIHENSLSRERRENMVQSSGIGHRLGRSRDVSIAYRPAK